MKLGICNCKGSGEKWRESSPENFWTLSSFVSWGKRKSNFYQKFLGIFLGDFHSRFHLRMAKGGGTNTKGRIWKCPFEPEKPLKKPWKCHDFRSRAFQASFKALLPREMLEECLKNTWKPLDLKIRVFSGLFQIPPFCAPTLCHSQMTGENFTVALCKPCGDTHTHTHTHTHTPLRTDFWEGDATKNFSVKKKVFSVKRGEAIQWMRGLVRISKGKAIQWRGPGDSVNRRTLKTEKLLSSSPSWKSALTHKN